MRKRLCKYLCALGHIRLWMGRWDMRVLLNSTSDEEWTFQPWVVKEIIPAVASRVESRDIEPSSLSMEYQFWWGESSWEPCDLSIQICYATADLRGGDDQRWLSNKMWHEAVVLPWIELVLNGGQSFCLRGPGILSDRLQWLQITMR